MADTIYVVQSPVIRTVEVIGQKSIQTIEAIKQGPPGIPHRYTETRCPNATITSVAATTASVLLLPANDARRTFVVLNDTQFGVMRLAFALQASPAEYTFLLYPGDTLLWETFSYTGPLSGIWDIADGAAKVTEIY